MKDLYRAIDALNEISQAERAAMRAQADAEAAAVRAAADAERAAVMKAAGRLPKTKAERDQEIRDFAKQQRAASKAAGYATKAEYDAAYQKNLDAIKAAGINLDDVYAAANKMASTEKGAARLAKLGIADDDDLISYVMQQAGIEDQTPEKYTATDFAITDIDDMIAADEKRWKDIERQEAERNAAKDARTWEDITIESEQELDERVTYATLAKLSGIKDPNKIYPGQKITLPGGGSYTVKKNDTLSGIAQAYRLGQIGSKPKAYNKIDDPKTKLPQISTLVPDESDPTQDASGNQVFKAPEKKKKDSLFKQFTDWAKGTKWYDIATTNPKVKTLPATVQGQDTTTGPKVKTLPATVQNKKVDLLDPKTAGVDLGDYGDTSGMSIMDLAKKIQADPSWQAKSDAEKRAENKKLAAYADAQSAELYKRFGK